MAYSPGYGIAKRRKRDIDHLAKATPKPCENCSEDECRFCDFIETSHWDSSSPSSPPSTAATDCALCLPEQSLKAFTAPKDGKGTSLQQHFPVCVDPECPESVCEDCPETFCEECSETKEDCEECLDQCNSECPAYPAPDSSGHPQYGFPHTVPYSELFGDQASHILDYQGRLPHLPPDLSQQNVQPPNPYATNPYTYPQNAATYAENPQRSRDELELSRVLMDISVQSHLLDSVGSSFQNDPHTSSNPASPGNRWMASADLDIGAAANDSVIPPGYNQYEEQPRQYPLPTTSRLPTNSYTTFPYPNLARADSIDSHPQHPSLITTPASSSPEDLKKSLIACQWASPTGQPCNQLFPTGTAMHTHLKAAHNTRTAVHCHWLGCRVSTTGANPHTFANSVERHTWGHSGHRPYQCPTCLEGFAAAAVRDEHIANIHLGRKNFACDICGHTCTSARNLKRHRDEKHNLERFQCEFCAGKLGKQRLFPRGSNLARHFRKCRAVLELFPEARGAAEGKIVDEWFPPGYKGGPAGMDRAKVVPPDYFPVGGE